MVEEVEEGVGTTMVGASLEVGGVMVVAAVVSGALVSAGLMANRSSSGAISALPSVVAKGSFKRDRS